MARRQMEWDDIIPIRLMNRGDEESLLEPITEIMRDGKRYLVIRMQGCLKHCKGCWNPAGWPICGGEKHYVTEILDRLKDMEGSGRAAYGIIFDGGEPFVQPTAVLAILGYARVRSLKTVLYTGYSFEEALEWEDSRKGILEKIDVLIDGDYQEDKQDDSRLPWVTTSNQRIIDSKKSLEKGEVVLYDAE